ncbi:MAG: efflux RND transporter periplasmic adaptor subunit [Vampirovibrionales bacterium]|nr:efflux RND transporter periplasmic adaptor subunit [Vampirovibrionales bacterium]
MLEKARLMSSLVLAGFLLSGCAQKPQLKAPPTLPVNVETIQSQSVEAATDFLARLDGRRTIQVMAQASGQVVSVAARSGQWVASHTPLLVLDSSPQQQRLSSLSAQTLGARQQVEQAQRSLQALISQKASVQEALNVAKIQLNRDEFLLPKEGASQQDVDLDRKNLMAAQAQYDTLEAQIKAQTAQVAAMTQQALAAGYNQQEQAAQLDDFIVRAPFDGQLGDIAIKIGQWVEKGTPVTSLSEDGHVEVLMSIPLTYVSQIRMNSLVRVNTLAGEPLGEARVSFVAPAVNPQTSSIAVRARFTKLDANAKALGLLRPEQAIRATIVWDKQKGITIAPETRFNLIGQAFVYVARPHPKQSGKWIAYQTPITLGALQHNRYVVSAGLKPGDRVIISHIQKLRHGAPIAIRPASESATP